MTDLGGDAVHYSSQDGVGTITIDRPKVNAYEIRLMEALRASLGAAGADHESAVVIVRSALPSAFSVGADINVWARSSADANSRLVDLARANAATIAASDKVFMAEIGGHALGGGLELALACDLRFAAEGDYQLGLPEVKLGLMPGNGGTQRLLRLVGTARALELCATGASTSPERAHTMGLVDRLFPADQLPAETLSYARAMARGPHTAIAAIKRSIREGAALSLDEALAVEATLSDGLYATADAAEGARAYVEKRPPRFGDGDMTA